LQADVSALVESVARLHEREPVPGHAPLTTLGADREMAALRSELAASAQALERLREGMQALERDLRARELEVRALPVRLGAPVASLGETLRARPEADWVALEQLARTWSLDPEATRSELMFRGPRELLERFGPPTHVGGDDGGETSWSWLRESPGGGWDLRVRLTLRDGYVAAVDVRRR
jgi:hypothetical protein